MKACLYIASDKTGTKNYPFLQGPEGDGFKNMLYSFVELKKKLSEHEIDLATRDINIPDDCQLIICFDNPHLMKMTKKAGQVWCLIINDPPIYTAETWDKSFHEKFDIVLTFDETLVDGIKYFYYPFAIDTDFFSLPVIIDERRYKERTLATFVSHAIHKYPDVRGLGSIIHKRYQTLLWYGKNKPNDFGFYGGTFKKRDYYFAFKGVGLVRRLLPKKVFHAIAYIAQRPLRKVYKGELGPLDKFNVIKNYNFYYCYENSEGINGYVCEKIFDCFYCGVVPVYWGAPNIKELIPYKCFIDGRDFRNEKNLYEFLSSMTYLQYKEYLENAIAFLKSSEMQRFTVENSVACIMKPILERLNSI